MCAKNVLLTSFHEIVIRKLNHSSKFGLECLPKIGD